MYTELIDYCKIQLDSKNIQKVLKRNFEKNNEYDFIKYVESFNGDKWTENLYLCINNIEKPKCKCCDNTTKFIDYYKGYRIYCSTKCQSNDNDIREKVKNVIFTKYGVNNMLELEHIRQKGIDTNNDDIKKEKIKITYLKNKEINKIKTHEKNEKYKEKNGYYIWDDPLIKNKKQATLIKNYGVTVPVFSDIIKDKIKQTNNKKYGVDFPLQCNNIKRKINNTVKNNKLKIINNFLIKDNLKLIKYDTINDEIHYTCNNNHTTHMKYQMLYLRNKNNIEICNICNPYISDKSTSIKEKELLHFIKLNYNDTILSNNKNIINPNEIDIYLPDLKLAIEFNGIYWHSELYKPKNYHYNKYLKCNNENIQLITVWEDDWIYKQNIIKSMILNKLNKSNKIYARKCEIRLVNTLDKSIFLNENHIQGDCVSSINIGLYYNNELMALMTFGKSRNFINNESDIELLRFCNKLNYSIVGGASKLFNYYINNYKFNSIISYANLDFSNGNMYNKLGFKYIKDTGPNYWWVKDNIRKHRYNFSKHILKNKNMLLDNETADECNYRHGLYKIYGNGSKLYKFL